jgi:hypothetical protein
MESTIGRHRFNAAGPNFSGETERADCLAEKGGLFVLRFSQRDLNIRAEKSDGEAGKTCSRTEVEQGRRGGIEMTSGEETLPEVAADNLLRIADSGEVSTGVPLQEKVEIDRELGKERGGGIRKVGNQEVSYFGFGEGWHRR